VIAARRATVVLLGLLAAASVGSCGSSDGNSAADAAQKKQADIRSIDQIEVNWHKASSTKNVDLMMSLWAKDATFTIGPTTLSGKAQIRDFFANKAAPFQPANQWVSDTPAYKIRTTVNGDKGTLYFECHYIDVKTQKVAAVVGADQDVARINGKWLITRAVAATPQLTP
jgi:hypothetical protein